MRKVDIIIIVDIVQTSHSGQMDKVLLDFKRELSTFVNALSVS